ncbi:MAG: LysR family transcriptional regulator [Comamonas sp.]
MSNEIDKMQRLRRLRFDLQTLRLLVAVEETGSITGAADKLSLTTAAVSRRITDLEEQFGVSFFVRRPHGMSKTDAGNAVLKHSLEMLRLVERMHDEALLYKDGARGVVRMAACTSAVIGFIPHALRTLKIAHHHITVNLEEFTSRDVVKSLCSGHSEIGIVEGSTVGTPDGFERFHYQSDQLYAVVPIDHPLADKCRLQLDSLLQYEIVSLQKGSAIDTLLETASTSRGVQLQIASRTRSFDSMLAMVQGGLGIGIAPKAICEWFPSQSPFRFIPLQDTWAHRNFVLISRREGLSTSAIKVRDFLVREITNA